MTTQERFNVDPSWTGVIRWGGLSLFIAGIIVIVFVIAVGVFQVTLPLDVETVLEDPFVPISLFVMTLVGEFLLFPGFLALYLALRDDDRAKMFLATAVGTFSVVMFFVSRGLIISLGQISGRYLDTTDPTMKAAYLAAAEMAERTQNVYSTMALIFLSLASILVGLVMLKGKTFSKPIGYIVILSGVFSIFTPFAVNLGIPIFISLIGLILMLIWQVLVGIRLFKLGRGARA
jgi:uncharacterized membrane protein HdeD (DUF308 family)